MTVERTISKRLAGDEDFALGEGTETQSRNGQNVTITQVRRIQPVNSIEELNALDTSRYVKACLFNATTDTFHLYEYSDGTWNLLKSADVDPAGSLALETKELASGQVAVTFTNPTDAAAFHVSGPDVDNTRLFAGKDYSVNHTTKTVTLFNSYPAGTSITSMFYELIGSNLGTASTLDFGRGDDQVPRNSDLVANTVAELRNIEPQSATDRIELLGHTIPGVGGGVFQASSTTDVDDNGVTITTAGGAKWVRCLDGYVTPEMFGAVVSTVSISSAAWNAFLLFASENNLEAVASGPYTINNVRLPSNTKLTMSKGKNGGNEVSNILGADSGECCFYVDGSSEPGGYSRGVDLSGVSTGNCSEGIDMRSGCFNFTTRNCDISGSSSGLLVRKWLERVNSTDTQFDGKTTGYGLHIKSDLVTPTYNYVDKTEFNHCRFSGVHGIYGDNERVCNAWTLINPVFNGCQKEPVLFDGAIDKMVFINTDAELNGLDAGAAHYSTTTSALAVSDTVIGLSPFTGGDFNVGDKVLIMDAGLYGEALESTVSSIDSGANTITIADPVSYAASSGAFVVVSSELYATYKFNNVATGQFIGGQLGEKGQGSMAWAVDGGDFDYIGVRSQLPFKESASRGGNYVGCRDILISEPTDANRSTRSGFISLGTRKPFSGSATLPSAVSGQGMDITLLGSGTNDLTAPYGALRVRRNDPNRSLIFEINDDSDTFGPKRDNEMSLGNIGTRVKEVHSKDGVVVTTPDGSAKYRIDVDNSGAIRTTLL